MSRISFVNRQVGEWSSYFYFVVFVLTFGEVFFRYVFRMPTIWTLEVCLILAGVQYALSGAFALERDAHIRIDLVYDRSPGWLRTFFDLVRFACTALFLGVIVWWGAKQALPSIMALEGSGTPWNSPQPMILKTVIPIAGLLMLLQAVQNTRERLKRLP